MLVRRKEADKEDAIAKEELKDRGDEATEEVPYLTKYLVTKYMET